MPRIECSDCHNTVNLKQGMYDKMLRKFRIVRGIQLGITKGIPSIIDIRLMDNEVSSGKATSFQEPLNDMETETLFIKVYRCMECRRKLIDQDFIIRSLKHMLGQKLSEYSSPSPSLLPGEEKTE